MEELAFQTTLKPLCRKNIVILALCESSCGYIGLTVDTKRKNKTAQKTGRGEIEISDDLCFIIKPLYQHTIFRFILFTTPFHSISLNNSKLANRK